MKLTGASADILRQLAETPFLGRGEISPMTGWSNSEAYRAADRLEDFGTGRRGSARDGVALADGALLRDRGGC